MGDGCIYTCAFLNLLVSNNLGALLNDRGTRAAALIYSLSPISNLPSPIYPAGSSPAQPIGEASASSLTRRMGKLAIRAVTL
jgi:hypothetical protein